MFGFSPVSTSSSLTPRRAAWSIRRSTSSGWCRWGLCVANEQYLQWALHVRESESVTLRENVTRRIHSPRYRCADLGSPVGGSDALGLRRNAVDELLRRRRARPGRYAPSRRGRRL